MAIQVSGFPSNPSKAAIGTAFSIPDEQYSERRASFKSIDIKTRILPELSKAPSSIAGDMNSERGFVLDSLGVSRRGGEGGGN